MKKNPNRYPKGWNKKRVQGVIAHYANQSDADAIAEADAAIARQDNGGAGSPLF